MKELSLKQILLNKINETEGYISKGTLALLAEQEGFLGETAGRCLRQLAEEGKILASFYKSKRNIDLVRYARLSTPKVTKPKIEIIIENGQPKAIYA